MKHKITACLFTLLFTYIFYVITPKAFGNTITLYPSAVQSAGGLSNISNALGSPSGLYASCSSCYFSPILNGYGFAIPGGATINSVTVQPNYYMGQNTCISFYSGSSAVTSGYCSDYSGTGFSFSPGINNFVDQTYNYQFSPGFTQWGNINPNDSGFGILLRYEYNPSSIQLYSLGVTVNYSPAVASLTVTGLATGSGNITFNASGNTTYTQAGEVCKVSLYEYNDNYPASPSIVTGGVAYILLEANSPRTTTSFQGNNTYLGYGFTSTVSTWEANNIVMPYVAGANVDIRGYTSCYHDVTASNGTISQVYDVQEQGLNNTLGIQYDPSMIATPSALQNISQAIAQPDCGIDLLCQFEQWLQQFWCDTMCPANQVDDEDLTTITNLAEQKNPTSYVISALSDIDTTNITDNQTIPPLTMTIATIAAVPQIHMLAVPGHTYTASDTTGGIQGIFTLIRPYEVIAIGLLFTFFCIGIMYAIF